MNEHRSKHAALAQRASSGCSSYLREESSLYELRRECRLADRWVTEDDELLRIVRHDVRVTQTLLCLSRVFTVRARIVGRTRTCCSQAAERRVLVTSVVRGRVHSGTMVIESSDDGGDGGQ
jgi:hypothetical protein